jgi:ATP synthase protein I
MEKPKPKRSFTRELIYYSSLGFQVALSIFIGLGAGILIDRRFETHPAGTLIFLGLGIAAAFRNLLLAIRKAERIDWKHYSE